MTRRRTTVTGALALLVPAALAWTTLGAGPAQAVCLPPCRTDQEGGIIDSFFPGLLLGLVIAVVSAFFAFREGLKRGRGQNGELVDTPETRDR